MNNWKYCTPEQGKRLVELGIENPSRSAYGGQIAPVCLLNIEAFAPVWDVAELGVLLPDSILKDHATLFISMRNKWGYKKEPCFVSYSNRFDLNAIITQSDTEAQARANLLIYLLENNHTTAAECNARLKALNL